MSINRYFVNYKVVILAVYGGLLVMMSFFKTNKIMLSSIYSFESMLGGDKFMHLILSSTLSLISLWALASNRLNAIGFLGRCFFICLLLVCGLFIDELHQAFVTSRRFEWLDLTYGVSGLGIGLAIYLVISLPKLTQKH